MTNSANLMGYKINTRELTQLTEESLSLARKGNQTLMACANPHSLATAAKDKDFSQALSASDHLIADGIGINIGLKLTRRPPVPRITGHDYFDAMMTQAQSHAMCHLFGRKLRVYFFGSSEYVLEKLSNKVKDRYPNLDLCGTLSPPYGDWSEHDNENMIHTINAAQPDILWVGMTAPKQEKWVTQNRSKLDAQVIGSIGAVFDFVAETYPRAPQWACKLGIEWLVRLLKEPKRLWRRTLVSGPVFLLLSIRS